MTPELSSALAGFVEFLPWLVFILVLMYFTFRDN